MTSAEWEYAPNGEIPVGRTLPEDVFRIAMKIEYDGAAYSGWQRQLNAPSIQETLEHALSKIANDSVQLVCAGRTDTGVHATSQFAHFDTRAVRPDHKWQLGANSSLPSDIAVSWVKSVPGQFHARFSAKSRTYRYVIYNKRYAPAILGSGLTWCRNQLDSEKMHSAAQFLLGQHDFSSFRAAGCGANSPVRRVRSARVHRVADFIVLEITANAFLQHMVRSIVGLLIKIGSSDLPPEYLDEILKLKDRTKSAPTAKPNGLYFVDVEYPPEFSVPYNVRGPSFLQAAIETNGSDL